MPQGTIYSAAPTRKTAEREVQSQGHRVTGSTARSASKHYPDPVDPANDVCLDGWDVYTTLKGWGGENA